ncbi:MAG: hypothetical protein K8R02_05860 [Anaerohalosphaeraceae bacterium]|nr:hypothetical protein [Anaerohalosphaeraceae bacterium]
MFWMVVFAIFLYFLCAALLVAEIFVPSFGLISVCALGALAGGVIIFFNISPTAGWLGVAIAVVMIPAVLIAAYKILPKTRFGKSVILSKPEIQPGQAVPDTSVLKEMLGTSGIAITDLRPIGMADFSGKRLECLAESGYINKDTKIEVIKVESTELTVRPVE